MNLLKSLALRLPLPWQLELKRLLYRRQIGNGRFLSAEPEFARLSEWVGAGDWVIDIGAHVGHYTRRLSELVGPEGRVIAVEPVPDTFALLAANVALFRDQNVTLLNLAASARTELVGMRIPDRADGNHNYYEAAITRDQSPLRVLAAAIDPLAFETRIRLIKIDAEGHDPVVLEGMRGLLARDHPVLIVETGTPAVVSMLEALGYRGERLPGSVNTIFRWSGGADVGA
jgi:FkbM family methyltransferase